MGRREEGRRNREGEIGGLWVEWGGREEGVGDNERSGSRERGIWGEKDQS